MGICSPCGDIGYDPVAESPAAYVCMMRERALTHLVANMELDNDEDDAEELEGMTQTQLRDYYDRKVKSRLASMNQNDQQAMFKRYAERENEKRQKQIQAERKKQLDAKSRSSKKLRNVSIRQRDFRSKHARRGNMLNVTRNMNTTVVLNQSKDGSDEGDVSIVNLNDSVSDMVSVGGQSMAGLSDTSRGGIKKVNTSGSNGADVSMMSGSDVQVVRTGGNANDTSDINMSMAGLSDMSVGDINRVNQDSMADYSMASLNEDSMAGVDDSAYKVGSVASKVSSEIKSSEGAANILDDLKQELGMNSVSNPQGTDHSFIKQQELQDAYRGSVVYDENEEDYDSEGDDGDENKPRRKSSFKKMRNSLGRGQVAVKSPRLADLAKRQHQQFENQKYSVADPIQERSQTQESQESPESAARPTNLSPRASIPYDEQQSNPSANKLSLRLQQTEDYVASSSSSEEDELDNVKVVKIESDSEEEKYAVTQ